MNAFFNRLYGSGDWPKRSHEKYKYIQSVTTEIHLHDCISSSQHATGTLFLTANYLYMANIRQLHMYWVSLDHKSLHRCINFFVLFGVVPIYVLRRYLMMEVVNTVWCFAANAIWMWRLAILARCVIDDCGTSYNKQNLKCIKQWEDKKEKKMDTTELIKNCLPSGYSILGISGVIQKTVKQFHH